MLPRKGPKGVPTFSLDETLPKFPLPSIEDTLRRYREAVLPFCASRDEEARLEAQLAKAKEQLKPIQALLEERREGTANYVHDEWWSKYGYLEDRSPITPIESTPLHFAQDILVNLSSPPSLEYQMALMASNAAAFHDLLRSERYEVKGLSSAVSFTMNQFRSLFECCRVPREGFDEQRRCFKTLQESKGDVAPRYFLFSTRGRLFIIEVDDPSTLQPVPVERIALAIKECISAVPAEESLHLGYFTGSNRDWWTEAYRLLSEDNLSAKSLDTIERALFIFTFDETSPANLSDQLRSLAITKDGGSRWYDKSVQFTMFANGKAGYSFEHSVMDAAGGYAMHEWCEEQFRAHIKTRSTHGVFQTAKADRSAFWKHIAFGPIPQRVRDLLARAKQEYISRQSGAWQLRVVRMQGIGRRVLSQQGVSSDSFCQMAFQDAYYQLYKRIPSTYESVGVLRFRHGRTETGRCASTYSKEFVEASARGVEVVKLGQLLRKSCLYHEEWIKSAAVGNGFDRHLFAIRCHCRENGLDVPDFLQDPLFLRASKWDLSTSNAFLSGTLQQWSGGTCFRPVAEDSIGIVYSIFNDHIDFTVMSMHPEFDKDIFLNKLTTRIGMLFKALQATGNGATINSKL